VLGALELAFDGVLADRHAEADAYYSELTPADASADEALVRRQAFAGMPWSKQLFNYNVARWLDGDPAQPSPPASRQSGRNMGWRTFDACDIMSMPDKWEYPWFAAWDLAFHCIALAHVRLIAVAEAVLLSVVAIVAAWAGYSAAKWGTESSLDSPRPRQRERRRIAHTSSR
jgi:hypothetical protein